MDINKDQVQNVVADSEGKATVTVAIPAATKQVDLDIVELEQQLDEVLNTRQNAVDRHAVSLADFDSQISNLQGLISQIRAAMPEPTPVVESDEVEE